MKQGARIQTNSPAPQKFKIHNFWVSTLQSRGSALKILLEKSHWPNALNVRGKRDQVHFWPPEVQHLDFWKWFFWKDFFLDFQDCEFLKTENKKKQNDVTPHRRIRRYTLCIENYLHRDFVGIPKYLRLKFPQNIMVRRVFQTENSTLKSYLAHSMRCSGNGAIYKEEKCFLWTQINTFSRKMLWISLYLFENLF